MELFEPRPHLGLCPPEAEGWFAQFVQGFLVGWHYYEAYQLGYVPLRRGKKVQLSPEVVEDVRKRLRRVAGQVQGVEKMLADGRECRDVVAQISAATKALEQAGFKLVAAGLTYCLDNPEKASSDGYPLEVVERLFMKLA
jgi:DNA-binding FrmR family transcriptional regulator